MMNDKIELIKEIYGLKEDDLAQRKEALEKLKPFIDEIMDRFYEKLLQKEQIASFIPIDRIDELKAKQIKFLIELLSKSFDEKLYNRIARVAIAHYHIGLDPISMAYGYHVLSELILAKSQKDPSLLPHLNLIIKYLKVAEAIMSQEYFAQKTMAQSPYRANDLFIVITSLHAAFMGCRESFAKFSIDRKAKEEFEKVLDELKPYRQVLAEAGLNLATIKRFCTEYANDPTSQTLQNLKKAIQKPLDDLQVSAYLSLASSLGTMHAMSEVIHSRVLSRQKDLNLEKVQKRIEKFLLENYGWAIEDLIFSKGEPKGEYPIIKLFSFKNELFYLAIDIKDVQNRLFIEEAIDLLTEAMKLILYVISKEMK